jgi:hypothetical protein
MASLWERKKTGVILVQPTGEGTAALPVELQRAKAADAKGAFVQWVKNISWIPKMTTWRITPQCQPMLELISSLLVEMEGTRPNPLHMYFHRVIVLYNVEKIGFLTLDTDRVVPFFK